MNPCDIASFYRFADVADVAALRDDLESRCRNLELLGTVLVAEEGVNGTLAGRAAGIRSVLNRLRDALALPDEIDARWTRASDPPFQQLRIREKSEVVALGRPDIRPQRGTGRHVAPEEWNRLLDDPDTLLIDTRNRYEIEVGTFPGSLDPGTASFREFANFAGELNPADKDRPVAMFCTGGIRCEKASALMLEMGYTNVNQLQGGVLNYLEEMPEDDSRWQGECFVFDKRVAVDRNLSEGGYVQCHACRRPLSAADLRSPDYREGVSCPKCITELDANRAERLEERRRQVRLARERGDAHIGK